MEIIEKKLSEITPYENNKTESEKLKRDYEKRLRKLQSRLLYCEE